MDLVSLYSKLKEIQNPSFITLVMDTIESEKDKTPEEVVKIVKEDEIIQDYKEEWMYIFGNELPEDLFNVRMEVLELLATPDPKLKTQARMEATELIVKEFLKRNKIYTTRNDVKSEIWIYREGIYIPQGKSYIEEFVRRILGDIYTTHFCKVVVDKICVDTYIDHDNFFKNNHVNLLCLKNGLFDLTDNELKPHNPEIIFFSKLPIRYNPDKKCPNVLSYFKSILATEDDSKVLQEFVGYCLLKAYPYHKALMLYGEGRNGKSTFLDLLKRFIGVESCCNLSPQQLQNRESFSISELFGKMVNMSGDIDSSSLKDTGLFKSLTGADMISAQRKFLPMLHFHNYAKQIYSCNTLPLVYDKSLAFWERWIFLSLPYQFLPKEEIELLDKENLPSWIRVADSKIIEKMVSDDELSGMFNWALEGLKRLKEQDGFTTSETAKQLEEEWLRKSNSFEAFLNDECVFKYGSEVPKSELQQRYNKYCRKNRVKLMGVKVIRRVLEERGIWDTQKNAGGVDNRRVWVGLCLKNQLELDNNLTTGTTGKTPVSHSIYENLESPYKVENPVVRVVPVVKPPYSIPNSSENDYNIHKSEKNEVKKNGI